MHFWNFLKHQRDSNKKLEIISNNNFSSSLISSKNVSSTLQESPTQLHTKNNQCVLPVTHATVNLLKSTCFQKEAAFNITTQG